MTARPTVLIAGAGVGGLTAALALRGYGFPVRLYERRSGRAIETGGTGLNLWSNATTLLARLGLGERLAASTTRIERGQVVSERNVPMVRIPVQRYTAPGSSPGVTLARGELVRVLLEACEAAGADVVFGRTVTGHRDEGDRVRLLLDGGAEAEGDVLLGADGIRSRTAAQVPGDAEPVYSGVTTYRGVSDGSGGVPPETVHFFQGPGGVNGGAWHVGRGRVAWTVGHFAPAGGRDEPGTLRERALGLVEGFTGPPRAIVADTPEERIIRTDLYHRPWRETWGAGRVTLLGDAAHAMPTVLGQGACQAIEDAAVLAGELAASPADPVAALRSYERVRKERVAWVRDRVFKVGGAPRVDHPLLRPLFVRLTRLLAVRGQEEMWRGLQRPPHLPVPLPARPARNQPPSTHR
ncbi:FAD-dependent monooxygenase [Streptomyces chumphonensis]|uniref:FAD-dependent monooxygenase n=1 Tax=Streptomyces chumphonensis TaxID=1214925 RepID=A0A927IBB7_9ACTN|nr:NAD(P)/FAD-dependent oxidoreductase [Streptomyces chumphonensis]MBD3930046.1 FAD-dependent monooxygenase [Streptomyces chumphonensis]